MGRNLQWSTGPFTVRDIRASLAYYRDKLGFDIAFEYGDPIAYAGVCSGKVTLHLIPASRASRQPGHGAQFPGHLDSDDDPVQGR